MKNNNEYHRKYNKRRYRAIREEIIKRLGGKCVRCGTITNLEIDHIDPSTKNFDSNKWLTVSNGVRDGELCKCQLLCKECHIKKSVLETNRKIATGTHGTLSSYRYCKCEKCKEAKAIYMKEYMKTYKRKRDG